MNLSSKIGLCLATAAVATSVSACGSAAKSSSNASASDAGKAFAAQPVKQIIAQAKTDMKSLTSMTMDGSITQKAGKLSLKLSFDTNGNCTGTIGMNGGSADLISVAGAGYLRGDEKFWRNNAGSSAPQILAVLGTRWAKLPPGANDFSSFCDLNKLLAEFDKKSGHQSDTKGTVTSVSGQDAIEIISTDKDGITHAWVATTGKHYILKLEHTTGTEPGTMSFNGFDQPVDAKAPAKDQYVDLAALGG